MPLQSTSTLEVTLEQSIRELYLRLFNHALGNVTCSHVADSSVAIVLEDVVTLPEQVLIQGNSLVTADALRRLP